MADRILLTLADVCERTALSKFTIYRKVAKGQFPKPIYPAARSPRWPSDEISDWIDSLMDARETGDTPAAA